VHKIGTVNFYPLEYPYLNEKLIPITLPTNPHFKLKKPPIVTTKILATPAPKKKLQVPLLEVDNSPIIPTTRSSSPPLSRTSKTPTTPPASSSK